MWGRGRSEAKADDTARERAPPDVDSEGPRGGRDGEAGGEDAQAIEPGGISPLATMQTADVDLDKWYHIDYYTSFDQHKAGADDILRREWQAGWLDWAATEQS